MLIWNAWRWMRGTVCFRAEGGLCERFLTLLGEQQPPVGVWNIRREDGAVTLCCRAEDYPRLRVPARRTGTRIRAQRKHGLPFAVKPLAKRAGLFVGAALSVALYMLLASRIWIVDIGVGDPLLAARIEATLAKSGVYIGARTKDVDIPSVRMHMIAEIQEINQLALYFDGSIARVDVQLQKTGAVPPDTSPANIIAAADGRIVTIRATIGTPLVMEGEAVIKGDLLVCGAVETEKGTLLRHASAVVLAETTHTLEESISLTEILSHDGRKIEQPSLTILSRQIPLYSGASFDETWTVTSHKRFLSLFGTVLPFGIQSNVYTERTMVAVTYTHEQAQTLAKERLEQRARSTFADSDIRNVIFEGRWEGDTYHLQATYDCVENIARESPLVIN